MMKGQIDDVILLAEQAIQEKVFPCIEIFFAKDEDIFFHEAFGTIDNRPGSPLLKRNALFDLASLTKPLATASAILHLHERKQIDIDDCILSYVPEFKRDKDNGHITIKHLLAHTSGLPDWLPLYEPSFSKEEGWQKLINVSLTYEPGKNMIYSCLGYIILAEIVKRVTSESLSDYCKKNIFGPLGLSNLVFNPDPGRDDIIPTAYCPFRGKILRGIVYDENAFLFDGEGGNAGLFGTMEEIYKYCLMLMHGGEYNGRQRFLPSTVKLFLENQNSKSLPPRTLGWDYKKGNDEYMSCGELMPVGSIGHLGFTGASIWFDPDSKYIVILLSNRVNFSREGNIPQMRNFRPKMHNLLLSMVM